MVREARPQVALPGDPLAVIEEFEGSAGTYTQDSAVRAEQVGRPAYELKDRTIRVQPVSRPRQLPQLGDAVIGQVESAQTSIANMLIRYVNGKRNEGRFTGMLMLQAEAPPQRRGRGGRGARPYRPRRGTICKAGDLVRAHVTSVKNAIIHLSLQGDEDGVVAARCSICGNAVRPIDGGIKCIECGNMEERRLASDFGAVRVV
jgi:exosome complex component CSL4